MIGVLTLHPDTRDPRYSRLESVLAAAYQHAATGKGLERHACGEPFEEQKICGLARYQGSIDGPVFQAAKKAIEAKRLPRERAVAELLGAINYLAAAVILIEDGVGV